MSSGVQKIGDIGKGINYTSSETLTTGTITKSFAQNNPTLMKVITITSGGLSGGFSSAIAGGNFWQGAKQGLIVAGLNHTAHEVVMELKDGGKNGNQGQQDDDQKRKIAQKLKTKVESNNNKILAMSLMAEVALEIEDPTEILTKMREKYIEVYAPQDIKKANEAYSIMVDIGRNLNENLQNVRHFTIAKYSLYGKIVSEIMITHSENLILENTIKILDSRTYYEIYPLKDPNRSWSSRFGGGGADSNY